MAPPASRTTAHASAATVAPFRAWRGLQRIIARGPARDTIKPDLFVMQILHPGQGGHYHENGMPTQAPPSIQAIPDPAVAYPDQHQRQLQ